MNTVRQKARQHAEPPDVEVRALMVERGDVNGLMEWIRSQRIGTLPPGIADELDRAIRKLGKRDLAGLADVAFGEILGMATHLLIRCALHIQKRLDESDASGGHLHHVPDDIDRDGWITRFERISRFVSEISTSRARVLHVGRLNDERKQTRVPIRQNGHPSPMDFDQIENGTGQAPARNGGGSSKAGRFQFT
jgi:hypothetical protein